MRPRERATHFKGRLRGFVVVRSKEQAARTIIVERSPISGGPPCPLAQRCSRFFPWIEVPNRFQSQGQESHDYECVRCYGQEDGYRDGQPTVQGARMRAVHVLEPHTMDFRCRKIEELRVGIRIRIREIEIR